MKQTIKSFEFWNFWRNTEDADVIRFLKFYTDLPVLKINELSSSNINYLKILLAHEVTSKAHGFLHGVINFQYIPTQNCKCCSCDYHINGFGKPEFLIELRKTMDYIYTGDDERDILRSCDTMHKIYTFLHNTYNKIYPISYKPLEKFSIYASNNWRGKFDEYMNPIIECIIPIKYFDRIEELYLSEEDYLKEDIRDMGIPLFKILFESKITESLSDARKLIKQGGIKVNYDTITNEFTKINEKWLGAYSTLFIQKGKKEYFIIQCRSFRQKDPTLDNYDLHHYNPLTKEFTIEKDGLKKLGFT